MSGKTEHLYGRNPVFEALRAGRRQVHKLLIADGADERGTLADLLTLARDESVPIQRLPRNELDQIHRNHQGVAAAVGPYPFSSLDEILVNAAAAGEPPLVLLLDVIQDPQNLGTLLRTAEAVGVHGVVLPYRRGVGVTASVVSASSGAVEHLSVAIDNLAQAIAKLKESDVWIYGLENSPESAALPDIDFKGGVGLVVGHEGEGMRRLVRESCDFLVRIPMRGRVESLNAATAGSIALYAIWEARGYQSGGVT